jgi:predicted HAD superfamily Cof-like phosphohydrolase
MSDFIERVIIFNRAANRPTEFDAAMVAKHTGYQLEELAEKLEAICDGAGIGAWLVQHLAKEMQGLGRQFKSGNYDALVGAADREAMLDADIDLMVVSVGSAMVAGADVHGAAQEVTRANLDKMVDGKFLFDENGKIRKPIGWTAPDLKPFVGK